MTMEIEASLAPFFAPHGVVVVGASHNPARPGFGLTRNVALSGYRGAIHFVNPRGGVLFGRPVYRQMLDARARPTLP